MEETLNQTQGLSDQIEGLCMKQQENFMKIKADVMRTRELAERTTSMAAENEALKASRAEIKAKYDKAKESLDETEELKGTFAWTKAALDSALGAQEEYRKGYKSMRSALKKATEDFDKFRSEIAQHKAERKEVEQMKENYKVLYARQIINTEKVVNRMAKEEDKRLQGYFVQVWLQGVAECKREKKAEKDAFIAEVDRKNAQAEFERQMLAKKEVAKRTLARMNAGNTTGLLTMIFSSWAQNVVEEKNAREADKIRQQVEARLKGMESKKKEDAKNVLDRMKNSSDTGVKSVCFTAWKESWEEAVAARELEKKTMLAGEAGNAKMRLKKEEAKKMLAKMNASTAEGLVFMVFSQWGTWALTERKERKLAEAAEAKFLDLQKKKKGEAVSVVERMNLRKGKALIQTIFTGWMASISQYRYIAEIEEEVQKTTFGPLEKEIDEVREQLEDKIDELEDVQEELVESQKRHKLLKEKIAHMTESHNGLLNGFDAMVRESET